jgi:MFS family permease
MFQAGRFICGLGIGILVTVCPMYLSEMSSALRRGWLVGHHAIFLVFGYMLSGWVGYACYYATGPLSGFGWRFPLALQCLPALVLLLGSPWLPRSPRWLISKGKFDEAQQSSNGFVNHQMTRTIWLPRRSSSRLKSKSNSRLRDWLLMAACGRLSLQGKHTESEWLLVSLPSGALNLADL